MSRLANFFLLHPLFSLFLAAHAGAIASPATLLPFSPFCIFLNKQFGRQILFFLLRVKEAEAFSLSWRDTAPRLSFLHSVTPIQSLIAPTGPPCLFHLPPVLRPSTGRRGGRREGGREVFAERSADRKRGKEEEGWETGGPSLVCKSKGCLHSLLGRSLVDGGINVPGKSARECREEVSKGRKKRMEDKGGRKLDGESVNLSPRFNRM